MEVLAIANQKGGVGKSTLAVNLGIEAVRGGRRVLLVDADTQSSATLFSAAREEGEPRFDTMQLVRPVLHREIPRIGGAYELVVIDVGGRDSGTFRSALVAADRVLIPLGPSAADLWASDDVLGMLDEVSVGKSVRASAVFTKVVHGTRVAREALAELHEMLKERDVTLLDTAIHARVAWAQSFGEGRAVTEWAPSSAAAEELRALSAELGILGRAG
jgi:chromosome partitioning protein